MSDSTSGVSETHASESFGVDSNRSVDGLGSHALCLLDSEGLIMSWSRTAVDLYGYETEYIVDEHLSTLFAPRNAGSAADSADAFLRDAKDTTVEVEHWHQRADGSVFLATLTLSSLQTNHYEGYVAVCQDTTVTREYQEMLEQQNDRLKQFTDILAHDLRNPLHVIKQRLMLYRETGDAEHLRSIDDTTERMTRLVDDLLRVARHGGVVEDSEPVDVGTVVERAWAGTGGTSGATLCYETVESVRADPDRLCQLFENLFRNSVEHGGTDSDLQPHVGSAPGDSPADRTQSVGVSAPDQAPLTVTVGPLADGFYVEDDGSGIPEYLRDEVLDHGVTMSENGTGYGLSVVRTVVNAHGWDIAVTEADSGGARFEITGLDFSR